MSVDGRAPPSRGPVSGPSNGITGLPPTGVIGWGSGFQLLFYLTAVETPRGPGQGVTTTGGLADA